MRQTSGTQTSEKLVGGPGEVDITAGGRKKGYFPSFSFIWLVYYCQALCDFAVSIQSKIRPVLISDAWSRDVVSGWQLVELTSCN